MKKTLKSVLALLAALTLVMPSLGFVFADQAAADPYDMPMAVSQAFWECPHTTRGFAWITVNRLNDSALYVVRAEQGQTLSDADFSSPDVVRRQAMIRRTHTVWDGQEVHASQIPGRPCATDPDTTISPTGEYWTYRAHITGLTEGATYFWRVGSAAAGAFSPAGSITTTSRETTDFDFLVINDVQGAVKHNFEEYVPILDIAMQKAPNASFLAMPGDLVDDSSNSGGGRLNMNEWKWFFDLHGDTKRSLPVAPAAGNHDNFNRAFADRFGINFAGYTSRSQGMEVGGDAASYGGFYAFVYGDVHFSVLNSNRNDFEQGRLFTQMQGAWFSRELSANQHRQFRVAMFHYSPHMTYSDERVTHSNRIRPHIVPLMARYNIDLVLVGHEHTFLRTNVFEAGEGADGTRLRTDLTRVKETFEGRDRYFYVEPNGTIYVKQNSINQFRYRAPRPEFHHIYGEELVAFNTLEDSPFYGQRMSLQPTFQGVPDRHPDRPGNPTFGVVSVRGNRLVYETFMVKCQDRTIENTVLIDYVAIKQNLYRPFERVTNELPGVLTISHRDAREVLMARELFDDLHEVSRQRVNPVISANFEQIWGLRDWSSALRVLEVEEAITAIGTVDRDSATLLRIQAAEDAYNALGADEKAQVANRSLLALATARISAQEVMHLIASLDPTAAAFGEDLVAARAAFGALNAVQRGLVTNIDRLTYLEVRQAQSPALYGIGFVYAMEIEYGNNQETNNDNTAQNEENLAAAYDDSTGCNSGAARAMALLMGVAAAGFVVFAVRRR